MGQKMLLKVLATIVDPTWFPPLKLQKNILNINFITCKTNISKYKIMYIFLYIYNMN